MRTQFIAIIGLGLMAGWSGAWAQNDEVPVPQPPYIEPVLDYGHWTVTFKYHATTPPAPTAAATGTPAAGTLAPVPATPSPSDDSSPVSIDTIKTGDLRGVVLTFPNGKTKRFTCQGDWVLNSGEKGAQLSIASPTALPYPYYTTGFILLDGVKVDLSTFREAAPHNGKMAFHYKSGDVDVWIDPATMLPLAAKQSGVEVTYQFLNPPPRPFDIPKDQYDLLHKEQQAYKATSSMR